MEVYGYVEFVSDAKDDGVLALDIKIKDKQHEDSELSQVTVEWQF